MRKRGATQVEMIFSFILFIGVVTFALFFFRPAEGPDIADSTLPFVFRELKQNFSVQMDAFSVKINSMEGDVGAIEFSGISGLVSRTEHQINHEWAVLPSVVIGESVNFEPPAGTDFISIKLSEDFVPSDVPSKAARDGDYELASSSTRSVISEKRVLELTDKYLADYNNLKNQLKLPPVMNFGFKLSFSEDDSIEGFQEIPQGIDVFSKIKRFEVLRSKEGSEGELVFADLSVTVW